jgi:hypothetical protein
MSYNDQGLLTDVNQKPIPQYFNPDANKYEALQGKNGASNVLLANAYDSFDDMVKVKSEQKKFRDGFAGTSLDLTKWKVVQQGAGQSIAVSNGVLTINAGTNPNDETIIQSIDTFTIPCRLWVGMMLSQRIANQTFWIELVSVDQNGNPDSKHAAAWRFDGTLSNQAIYEVQYGGLPRLASSAVTLANPTSSYAIREIELFNDEAWFHERGLDSAANRSNSWVRHQQTPDPNAKYVIRIHVLNGSMAPGSNTALNINLVGLYDYTELTTEVTGGRGSTNSATAEPVWVTNTVPVSGTVSANAQSNITDNVDTTTNLGAGQTFTGTSRDGGSPRQFSHLRVTVAHQAGMVHGHLVIEQSTDNSTWRETFRVPIPSDGQYRTVDVPWTMRYIRTKFINGSQAQTLMFISSAQIRIDGYSDQTTKKLDFVDSTTTLGSGASFTSVTLNLGVNHNFIRHRVGIYSDQAGTLQLQQSRDGVNWRTVASVSTTAGQFTALEAPIQMQYVRYVHTNGATAQSTFEATSSLLAA